ncbi:amino acid/amide ABC transporter membrane protein 2, HAAT family [Gemmobacter megaterium]|uniref:Amino acid/amide ABC transporter membrane protein 2, HAAT family n=1 Tax=Gemmobacter megaterium TaxID=1086013 RepID=A0A1N7QDG4_9RHOB|nr:branched-chain amino acid ABC transporter permease [Gemmobacter megaterium]GGE25082.1 branched-chain amino acid ABC transporter permease [Gemmobacter megaterium]SIT20900.1 amino acid/amide ABC transporter membrane protein 2, HAAT family [Gemmobacter megaterium]
MSTQSQEMKSLGVKIAVALAAAVLLAVPFLTDFIGGNSALSLITRILIYSIAAASLNFVLGYGGMVSLGHAAFFGIGGYVVGLMFVHYTDETPLLGFIPGSNQLMVTIPAAILVSGLLAFIIGALSLRTGGVQFIMITLAFAQMIFFFFVSLKAYGGEDGIIIRRTNEFLGLNMRDRMTLYYVVLGFWVLFMLALWRVIHSSFGTVLRGMRQNERRMAALGFAPYRYKLYAFVLSGMGCGLAGALMANFLRFASPDMLHWTKSAAVMTMVILGGVGSFFGPLLGTAAYLVLETELAALTEYWQFWLGLILMAVVLGTKGGLNALVARGVALIFRGRT